MSATASTTVILQSPATTSRLDWLMRSSVGQKLVMAVTGVILSLFIVVHMLGNLSAFSSALAINQYGAALRKIPALLWGARIGLLAAAGLHIWMYLVLLFRSWSARPQGYRVTTYQESTLASRTMRWTGVILAAFVIYHLLHLTTGQVHPDFKAGDIYHNLVTGLQVVPVALFYIVAMVALGFHVFHGVWSLFQSLGISQPRYNSLGRYFATLFTFIVVAGFAAIPIAILAGLLR